MKFTKNSLPDIRKVITDVLNREGIRMDIEFKLGNITYQPDGNSFSVKLEAFNTEGGRNAEEIEFDKNCRAKGIPSNWYGEEVELNGKMYIVCGVAPRARKYPVLLRSVATGVVDRKSSADPIRTKIENKRLKPVFISESDTAYPDDALDNVPIAL